jgi:lysophospholipase L1-like esterase
MANVKISGLPAASTLTGAELVPVVQSGVTSQTTLAAMPYVPSGTGAVTTTVQTKLRESVSVLDFGADSTGTTDSYTAFNNAGNYGYVAIVPAGTYNLSATPLGRFLLLNNAKLTGTGANLCKAFRTAELPYLSQLSSNQSYEGLINFASSIFVLGDSITAASGASSYPNGYSFQFIRSLLNARNYGYQNDPGYEFHVDINQSSAVYNGYSSTGSIVSSGISSNRRSLAAGQSITITQRFYNTIYVVYDGAASTGSLIIAKNGTTLGTQAVSGSTLNNTSAINDTFTENDSVTITASGGTVVVCGVLTLKTAQGTPIMYVSGNSGTAYQDYTTTTAMDEIGYWLNLFRSSNEKCLVLALGTNNLYNAGKSKTPSAMVSEIGILIAGIQSRCSTIKFVISVPPKADESVFPIIASGYAYQDYVDAIVEYAFINNHGVLRNDKSVLSRTNSYYSDGVHPNNYGHRIMAQTFCETLGIPLNSYIRTIFPSVKDLNGDIVMNSTWRPFTNNDLFKGKAHLTGNVVTLSGIVEPNGSISTTVGTIPSGFRPVGRTCYIIGRNDAGVSTLSIDTSGLIVLTAVPASWFSLENISFPVNR